MGDSMTPPAHEIIVVRTPEERQQCYDVRIAVFHVEQKFPLDTEIDEYDEGDKATHFLMRLTPSLEPIGTIRASGPGGGSYYKLSRLAVLKSYRQHRFGAALVRKMHDWVVQDASTRMPDAKEVEIICHSQIPAKGFYARFGYTPSGDEFDEDGDPHQKMVLRLPLSSPHPPESSSA